MKNLFQSAFVQKIPEKFIFQFLPKNVNRSTEKDINSIADEIDTLKQNSGKDLGLLMKDASCGKEFQVDTKGGNLRVRDDKGAIKGALAKGEVVKVVDCKYETTTDKNGGKEESHYWFRVSQKGKDLGWVSAEYLKLEGKTNTKKSSLEKSNLTKEEKAFYEKPFTEKRVNEILEMELSVIKGEKKGILRGYNLFKAVQTILKKEGLYDKKVDGLTGKGSSTESGLKKYQEKNKLKITGAPTQETIEKMLKGVVGDKDEEPEKTIEDPEKKEEKNKSGDKDKEIEKAIEDPKKEEEKKEEKNKSGDKDKETEKTIEDPEKKEEGKTIEDILDDAIRNAEKEPKKEEPKKEEEKKKEVEDGLDDTPKVGGKGGGGSATDAINGMEF